MKKLFFFLVLTSFIACTNEGTTSSEGTDTPTDSPEVIETRAYNNVLETHDDIMPKLAPLQKMAFKLEDWSKDADAGQQNSINSTVALINQAEDSMNEWMEKLGEANPTKLRATKSHEEIMEIMAVQEENAAAVAKQFQEAYDQASGLLGTLSGEKGISLTPPSN